jgi:beta-fructofuranosidase
MNRREFLAAAAASSALATVPSHLHALAPRNLAADPLRPQFHLLPARNWMNDPNGPIYWKGNYHMFFQYNPSGATWGNMSWNHAVSPDMIHWTHLPLAMTPTPGGPDAFGCFSGTAIQVGSRAYFIYTGTVQSSSEVATIRDGNNNIRETQCLAWSDDLQLVTWHKDPAPIIPNPPPGMKITGFRDPSLWKQGDWYYMTVGSGIVDVGGGVLLYRSPAAGDLRQWEYLHLLTSGAWNGKKTANPCDDGEMWECPDFFALDGGHVLIYSTLGKVFWQSGNLDAKTMKFTAKKTGLLDLDAFYAPKTQLDKQGRRILWGWIPERRSEAAMREAGWSGMMSLPRVLNLDKQGRLRISALPELAALRSTPLQIGEQGITIPRASGEASIIGSSGVPLELVIQNASDQTELLRVTYSPQTHVMVADGNEIQIDPGESPSIHIFADGSVIELILAGRIGYTRRFYYSQSTAPDITLLVTGAIPTVQAWSVTPISTDRLTTPARSS